MHLLRAVAFALLAFGGTRSGGAEVVSATNENCTVERMETTPLAVLEPCSALLGDPQVANEKRAEALFIRGRAHHRSGSIDLAAEDYDEALKLAPNNEEIHLARANIDFRRGFDDEALERIQKAIALNPANPRVLRAIGAVFSSAGQAEEALRYLSAAIKLDPADPYSLYLRSQLHAQKRRHSEALVDADALVAIAPDEINRVGYLDSNGTRRDFRIIALAHRAGLYESSGRYDLAERDLNAAVAYKAAPEALLARGEFLANRSGRQIAALNDIDAVIRVEPRDPRAHFARATALTNLRRLDEAVQALDTAIALQPAYPAAFRLRARVHRELGQADAAVQDFVTAIRQDSTLIRETMPALRAGGYWRSMDVPIALTPELHQAVRACMLAARCN